MIDPDVYELLRCYPMIYLACHIDHVRSTSTRWKLSSHDSSILAHLDISSSTSPRDLAKHLGVAASTLSASITRLTKLGYIESAPASNDRRRKQLRLTQLGVEAMAGTSVLDVDRVKALLKQLKPAERKAAVEGLALLAKAARKAQKK